MWLSCAECGEPYEYPEEGPPGPCPRCGSGQGGLLVSSARSASLRSGRLSSKSHDDTVTAFGSTDATSSGTTREILVESFGDYELLGEIARGGMGVVFRARQKRLDRVVALKMILGSHLAHEEDVLRFQIEAEAAARLDHPGIVPIHEVGEYAGQHFYSMSFVEGGSLKEFVDQREEPLTSRRAAELLRGIAEAVRYAHARNIVHRDLKPANVLLDLDGNPRVTDFGLAKVVGEDSGLTRSGAVLGTPGYMPPEQAIGGGENVGPPSDVYGLGAILYFLLAGRPPFRAENAVETVRLVTETEATSPREWNPLVDRDLATICLKCLEKDPARRYASAAHLVEELDRYLDGLPIVARPISRFERSWRWCRRRPVQALLSIALVASVLLGVVGTSTFAVLMQRKAKEAELTAGREAASRRDAERERRRAVSSEYESLLGKVQLETAVHPDNGWSWSALADLERAVALDVPDRDEARLRTLAARTLLAFDLRPIGRIADEHRIEDLAFTPDGKRLLAGVSKKVPICPILEIDVPSGRVVREYGLNTLTADYWTRLAAGETFQSGIRAVAADPTGRWVAGGTRFGRIAIWNTDRPDDPPQLLEAHEDTEVFGLEFVLGGDVLVSTPKTKDPKRMELRFWRIDDEGRWSADGRLEGIGREIAVHPNGRWLAHSLDRDLGLLDLEERRPVEWWQPRTGGSPTFSADGLTLASEDGNRIVLYDVESGREITEWRSRDTAVRHDGDALAFVGDTRFLITSDGGHDELRCLDSTNGTERTTVGSAGFEGAPFRVSPDGRYLAVAEFAGVGLYEISTPVDHRRLPCTVEPVVSADFSEGGAGLVWVEQWTDSRTISTTTVRRTDLRSGSRRILSEVVQRGRRWVADDPGSCRVRALPDGDSVVVLDGTIGLHPLAIETGELAGGTAVLVDDREFEWPDGIPASAVEHVDAYRGTATRMPAADEPVRIRATVDTSSLPSGSDDNLVALRYLVRGANGEQYERWEFAGVVATDGKLVVEVGRLRGPAGEVPLFDAALAFPARKRTRDRGRYAPRFGETIEVSRSGDRLWAVLDQEWLHAWSLPELREYTFVDSLEKIYSAKLRIRCLAGGRERLAIGSASGHVLLLDAETGVLLHKLEGPGGEMLSVDLSPDERLIVAGTDAGRVAAWRADGTLVATADVHDRGVTGIRILDDGDSKTYVVCTAGIDGRLGFWRVGDDWSNELWLDPAAGGPATGGIRDLRWSSASGRLVWVVAGERTAHVLDLRRFDTRLDSLGLQPFLR